MQSGHRNRGKHAMVPIIAVSVAAGLVLGVVGSRSLAQMAIPTEHKGLEVASLGVVGAASIEKQLGLNGHKMQLREITILPGGQIAKHSHEKRPGLVKVISGTWTEGRPSGERDYSAGDAESIIEDAETVHWFWNKGSEPATALVCDIVPDG